jgi:hypothetical protein
MENYIINPISGRPILYNGAIHRRLIQNKQILQSPKNQRTSTITKPKKTKQSNYESDCDENESDTETAEIDLQEIFNKLNFK